MESDQWSDTARLRRIAPSQGGRPLLAVTVPLLTNDTPPHTDTSSAASAAMDAPQPHTSPRLLDDQGDQNQQGAPQMNDEANRDSESLRALAQPANEHARDVSGVARLLAVGVGGGGVNAINRMIEAQVHGVEFLAMNTDAQALAQARPSTRLRLGEGLTRGMGAGGNPEVGRRAAEESYAAISAAVAGADMVFITAGMGGGTGTGASPLVAQAAHEQGALTVAVVTTPFAFERKRQRIAEQGLAALRQVVDALIVVPNERLMQLATHELSMLDAYRTADDVLRQAVQGISDLITIPGLINLDFADVRAVMADAGSALMSVGQASGEQRAEAAARAAITNPLLEVDIRGARGVIFNITGGDDLTMREVNTIAEMISGAASADANVIFGTAYDPHMSGELKVTVVATGFEPRVAHTAPALPVAQPQGRASTATPATTAVPASTITPPTGATGVRRSAPALFLGAHDDAHNTHDTRDTPQRLPTHAPERDTDDHIILPETLRPSDSPVMVGRARFPSDTLRERPADHSQPDDNANWPTHNHARGAAQPLERTYASPHRDERYPTDAWDHPESGRASSPLHEPTAHADATAGRPPHPASPAAHPLGRPDHQRPALRYHGSDEYLTSAQLGDDPDDELIEPNSDDDERLLARRPMWSRLLDRLR